MKKIAEVVCPLCDNALTVNLAFHYVNLDHFDSVDKLLMLKSSSSQPKFDPHFLIQISCELHKQKILRTGHLA